MMNQQKRLPIFPAVSLALMLLVILLNALNIGERSQVANLTNIVSAMYAIIAAGLGFMVWNALGEKDAIRLPWAWFTIGLGLWGVAESAWAILSFYSIEPPYPSLVDALWLAGYPFIFASSILRFRLIKTNWHSRGIQALVAVFILISILVSILAIYPIVIGSETGAISEILLSIAYPIGNLLVLASVTLLVLTFSGGQYSHAWAFIALGLATLSASDILFVYFDWNGLYFPEGELNWQSALVDATYGPSYILISLGILANKNIIAQSWKKPVSEQAITQPKLKSANLQKIMVFTDPADKVVFANQSLQKLLTAGETNLTGKLLWDALQINETDAQKLSADLKHIGIKKIDKLIYLRRKDGSEMTGWLHGAGNFNDLREYTGADITLEVEITSRAAQAASQSVPTGLGANQGHALLFDSFEAKLLLDYFCQKTYALHGAIAQMGGSAVSSAFEEIFLAAAKKHECAFRVEKGNLVIDELPSQPGGAYTGILNEITKYAISIVSENMVSTLFKRVDSATTQDALELAEQFGLRQKS